MEEKLGVPVAGVVVVDDQVPARFKESTQLFADLLGHSTVAPRTSLGTNSSKAASRSSFDHFSKWHRAPEVLALLHLYWKSTILRAAEDFAVSCMPLPKDEQGDVISRISLGGSECFAVYYNRSTDQIFAGVHVDRDQDPFALIKGFRAKRVLESNIGPENWAIRLYENELSVLFEDDNFISAINTHLHRFRAKKRPLPRRDWHNEALWNCVTKLTIAPSDSSPDGAKFESGLTSKNDGQKQDKFEKLSLLPACESVIRMNALYLSEARGESFSIDLDDWRERQNWALTALPRTVGKTVKQKRLSTLSIGTVETFVVYRRDLGDDDVDWKITSTRSALTDASGSLESFEDDFPGIRLIHTRLTSIDEDQVRIYGNGESFFQDVIRDKRVIRGLRDIANRCSTSGCGFAIHTSQGLMRAVVGRAVSLHHADGGREISITDDQVPAKFEESTQLFAELLGHSKSVPRIDLGTKVGAVISPERFDHFSKWRRAPEALAILRLYWSSTILREAEDFAISCMPGSLSTDPKASQTLARISLGNPECLALFYRKADDQILVDIHFDIDADRDDVLRDVDSIEEIMESELKSTPRNWSLRCTSGGFVTLLENPKFIEATNTYLQKMRDSMRPLRRIERHNKFLWDFATQQFVEPSALPVVAQDLDAHRVTKSRFNEDELTFDDLVGPYKKSTRETTEAINGAPCAPITIVVDPDKTAGACEEHEGLQHGLEGLATKYGYKTYSPERRSCEFDVGWKFPDGTFVVVEVKTLAQTNESDQLRKGLGQVLEYAYKLERGQCRVMPVLYVGRAPTDESWIRICERVGVTLAWPDEERWKLILEPSQ